MSWPALFLFFANTHLFVIGMACLGFSTNLQVPIFLSWANLAFIAFSHLGHLGDFFTSFKVGSPSFTATEKVLSQTVVAALTISSSSSLLEKGLWRWQ